MGIPYIYLFLSGPAGSRSGKLQSKRRLGSAKVIQSRVLYYPSSCVCSSANLRRDLRSCLLRIQADPPAAEAREWGIACAPFLSAGETSSLQVGPVRRVQWPAYRHEAVSGNAHVRVLRKEHIPLPRFPPSLFLAFLHVEESEEEEYVPWQMMRRQRKPNQSRGPAKQSQRSQASWMNDPRLGSCRHPRS